MKNTSLYLIALAMLAALGAPRAAEAVNEAAGELGVLPPQKALLLVTEKERNPFADRDSNKEDDLFDDLSTESQESRIRKVFSALRVRGLSRGTNGGMRVLIGDIDIRQGEEVPPVIIGQTERLVVVKITEEQVLLSWVDAESDRLENRKLVIPIGLQPSIEFELKGQGEREGGGPVRAVLVYDKKNGTSIQHRVEQTANLYKPEEMSLEGGRDSGP